MGVFSTHFVPLISGLAPNLSLVEQIEWKYAFSTFGSKIKEFEQKKSEKSEKIPKT